MQTLMKFRIPLRVIITAMGLLLGGAACHRVDDFVETKTNAEKGDYRAQYGLGLAYESGDHVERDFVEAAKWYRKSADQGYDRAQDALGWLYRDGKGVRQDDNEADHWFRLAANQGHANAQTILAVQYAAGRGVPHDYVQAYRWAFLANKQGNIQAARLMEEFKKEMSSSQVADAEHQAGEFVPKRSAVPPGN